MYTLFSQRGTIFPIGCVPVPFAPCAHAINTVTRAILSQTAQLWLEVVCRWCCVVRRSLYSAFTEYFVFEEVVVLNNSLFYICLNSLLFRVLF